MHPRSRTRLVPESSAARLLRELGAVLGRSLFPLVAILLIGGTFLWGPWGTALLAVVWWRIVARVG